GLCSNSKATPSTSSTTRASNVATHCDSSHCYHMVLFGRHLPHGGGVAQRGRPPTPRPLQPCCGLVLRRRGNAALVEWYRDDPPPLGLRCVAEGLCLGRWFGCTRNIRAMAQKATADAGRTNEANMDTDQDTGQRQSAPDVFAAR